MKKRVSEVKKILTILLLAVFVSAFSFADSFWEGSIATANYGDLPDKGFYGASNAFPLNSNVVVTNTKNGKKVTITIVKRLANSNVFIALSREAGEQIGLARGEMASGSMTLKTTSANEGSSGMVSALDQGTPPPSGAGNGELALIREYINTELDGKSSKNAEPLPAGKNGEKTAVHGKSDVRERPEMTSSPLPSDKKQDLPPTDVPSVITVESGVASAPPVHTAVLPAPDIARNEIKESVKPSVFDFPVPGTEASGKKTFRADAFPSLSAVSSRDTPEVISLIAHPEETHFTPVKMDLPQVSVRAVKKEETPPQIITSGIPDRIKQKEESVAPALPDVVPEKKKNMVQKHPLLPVKSSSLTEKNPSSLSPGKVEVVLEPAQPRPPAPVKGTTEKTRVSAVEVKPKTKAASNPAEEVAASSRKYTLTSKLKKGAFYLQLGAYKEEYSAKDLADALAAHYPVTVFVSKNSGISRYKVMVGPLNSDEGGSLLFSFRARGYKDAFLRRGRK